jgi:hypothetical protein
VLQLSPLWFAGLCFLSAVGRLDRHVQGWDFRANKGWLMSFWLEGWEFQPERESRCLKITFEVLQIADFGSENREFYPAIKGIVSGAVEAEIAGGSPLSEMFCLHFPDTLADPLGGPYVCTWLSATSSG